ncbi:MAG TPA: hypothetical protein G4N95_00290 [Anaerolineae bacterium]|nr:hypothetical protein [Anaerolineae bacterium]
MKNKQICLDLAHCNTEQDVIKLLKEVGYWDNLTVWQYYGDNENNFATIGNQQSRPDAAIVEKIINSVDAVLMAECQKQGITPEGENAPKSITAALEQYFNIPNGKLSNITTSERRNLAKNICLVATGLKANPCYSIIDQGEGQSPNMMPNTLLSIGKSNKLRIAFVQGKFNMGGTGVLQFCGKRNLQLIISRRHPDIAIHESDPSSSQWGFTIVRRENPTHGVRSSFYRYLAPGGKILSFNAKYLPLLPGDYPNAYGRSMKWGTYIKLYEYQMTGLKTNVKFDLYNRLSLLMPSIALPIRLYERRKGYAGHTQESTLSGLTVRLEEDKRENLEDGYPTTSALVVQGQKIKISIFAFKRGQAKKYKRSEGIIFVVNGQTHGYLSKSFFSRESVKMGYLADSLLILVDCTEFDGRTREDLFMNSRDRLRAGGLRSRIERQLEEILRNHQGLKDLRERRRREDIENKLEDSKPLADIIETIIQKSPTLSKLFIQGVKLPNPFKTTKTMAQKSFQGKRFPTYFKLTKEYHFDNPRRCPINVRLRVQYKTDVANDYFDRDKDPGTFMLKANRREISDFSVNLWNGLATLNVSIPHGVQVGKVIHFQSEVYDISRVDPISEGFHVLVENAVKQTPGLPGKRKHPASDEEGDDIEQTTKLDLPNIREVRQNEWEHFTFDRESALKVINSGEEGYDFFINMDNVYLLTEKKSNTKISPKLLDARYKYGIVLLGISLLKANEVDKKYVANENINETNVYNMIEYLTRVVSPILLPLITGLGELRENEITAVYEDE